MKIILLLIYVLTIISIIFWKRKSPTEAMFWVLVVVCLPYVGIILLLRFREYRSDQTYYLLPQKALQDYCPNVTSPKLYPDGKNLSEEDRQVMRFNAIYNCRKVPLI